MASGLLSVTEAKARLLAVAQQPTQHQLVPLSAALNRVLQADIIAPFDVPGYDNSGMDGYAFRYADAQRFPRLTVIGQCLAGHPFTQPVPPGACVRIMTGAPLPSDCDTVVMQESTEFSDEQITVTELGVKGQHVRRRGENLSVGHTVLAAGHRLSSIDIGLLAAMGIAQVAVAPILTVAVLSTGDELVQPGQPLASGQLYDSNRPLISAMLQRLGCQVVDLGIIRDDPKAIAQAFTQAAQQADVVISSGGVSVGDADYTKQVLNDLGEVGFWKVAIKPGKPFAFGTLSRLAPHSNGHHALFIGLPGNPVSTAVTLHQLAMPLLRKLSGEQVEAKPALMLPLAKAIHKKPGRTEYLRAHLLANNHGVTQVQSLGDQGSAILSSFIGSDGFIVLAADRGEYNAGQLVEFIPFDELITSSSRA